MTGLPKSFSILLTLLQNRTETSIIYWFFVTSLPSSIVAGLDATRKEESEVENYCKRCTFHVNWISYDSFPPWKETVNRSQTLNRCHSLSLSLSHHIQQHWSECLSQLGKDNHMPSYVWYHSFWICRDNRAVISIIIIYQQLNNSPLTAKNVL